MRKPTLLADSVLALIEWQASDEFTRSAIVEPYANGRERGWVVINNGKSAAFSENRNSDDIVIYTGNYADFAMAGNVPSDKVYKSKKFFSCTEPYEVAKFILEFLVDSK